ncbi:oxamate carbamoyltransferase subunit AllH family protein [Gudongella sp. SC589]|uniref:DUF2877 domain-containing protein n=1 Tax=Gudongella sp. SC589 TaxID=3385990 RepID=UPI003904CCDD
MLQKKTINPLAIDGDVIPLLERPNRIRIHSQFENTINYITDQGLMVVTMNEEVLPPLGIILSRDNFREFSLEKRKFVILESRVYSSYIDTYGKYPDGRIFDVYMKRFLHDNLENGLGLEIEEIEKILKTRRLSNLSEEDKILWDMINGAGAVDIGSIVGRGKGLTPAWDDFIVGFYAVLRANCADEAFRHRIEELLFDEDVKPTTDISHDFLTKAVKGSFSQNIISLVNSIQNNIFDEKSYLNVIKYGGTSGVDTFIGIMSGYASLLGFRTI